MLDNLLLGLSITFSLTNLAYAFVGCVLGTLIGVLPGIGPISAIAMLLPITFELEPVTGLIMLAAIYYGAQYGGSTTAILINLPGESSAVVTCLDGYQMARKGEAGAALGIAAIGSFVAGTIATVFVAAAAPTLAGLSNSFGAAEYFSLMVLGLLAAVSLSATALLKSLCVVIVGLFIGLIGTDINSATMRFTFGLTSLYDGIEFVALAIGMFAIAEIVVNLEKPEHRSVVTQLVTSSLPSFTQIRQSAGAILRGTGIGSILGILPGGGALLSSFAAYSLEKKIQRTGPPLGTGRIEGVAAPEAANNAGAQTSFIPMMTLGLPSNPVMALMLGALMVHGVQPGPNILSMHPDIFWGVVASMWTGNLMLLLLNLPLIGLWVRFLSIPYETLFVGIVLLSCIGVYSTNFDEVDVYVAAAFGVIGYVFRKLECDPAPLVLGVVLGPIMEENFRRALNLSRGDPSIFLQHPLSAALLFASAVLLLLQLAPSIRRAITKTVEE
jgi:TctA family transporter